MSQDRISYRSYSYYEVSGGRKTEWRDFRGPEYQAYRRLWDDRPARKDPGEFPLHLDIETTNACNLRCIMCPRTIFLNSGNKKWSPDGRIGFMTWELYQDLIDQAAAGGAYSVKLNFLGEPLLHPQVVKQVRYAKENGLEVMMNTNATLLTEEMSHELLIAGLDDVFFSVDSPYRDEYEHIRAGAKFEEVLENIQTFIEIKDRLGLLHVQTRASMVVSEFDPTGRQVREDYKKLFTGLGVSEIGFGIKTDLGADYWKKHGPVKGFACRDPYHRLFVYWDGQVGPCCGQWERRLVMGDARQDQIKDIWRNSPYTELRQAHESGRYFQLPACRDCSVPWLSQVEVEP
ncbi:MAG: radical SAM protein [Thermodesulfobacteriota bacterium]